MRIAAQRTDLEAGFLDRVEGVRTERFVDGNFSHSTLFAVCAPFALEKIGYYYIMIILSEIRPRRCVTSSVTSYTVVADSLSARSTISG